MPHTVTIDSDERFVRKWYAQCSCGWVGTGATQKEVEGYKDAHLAQAAEREKKSSSS